MPQEFLLLISQKQPPQVRIMILTIIIGVLGLKLTAICCQVLDMPSEGPEGSQGVHQISFTGTPNNGLISTNMKGNFGDNDLQNDFNF